MKRSAVMSGWGLLLLVSIMCVTVPHAAFGTVPQMINLQGVLLDSGGSPVGDGAHNVTFRIYDANVDGTLLWSEATSVTTTNGLFNVALGGVNPVPDSAIGYSAWLGIQVEADLEMAPRTHLVSVSHAIKIETVDGAKGGDLFGDIALHGTSPDDFLSMGPTDPNVALVLRSGATGGNPYIDFANDPGGGFDARIQLQGNDGLQISVPTYLTVPTGHLGLGITSPGSQTGLESARLEIADEDGFNGDFAMRVAGVAGSPAQFFAKSRGTLASPTIAQSGDVLGNIVFTGHDGAGFGSLAAMIRAAVDGTPGSGDMPGRLEFRTTPDGAASPATRMTIASTGHVGIGTTAPEGALDVASTTGALIVPRMTTTQRDALAAVNGMIVYNTTTNQFNFYENGAWVTK